MDRLKFRAKALEGSSSQGYSKGDFIYGYLYQEAIDNEDIHGFDYCWFIKAEYGDHFIDVEVDIETVGSCTGLKDKNGKLIYEGDILKDNGINSNVVIWDGYRWNIKEFFNPSFDCPISAFSEKMDLEIIGNVHEKGKVNEEF